MRDVKYTSRFKRDYKREQSGRYGKKLDALLMEAVNLLAADATLPRRYFDRRCPGSGTITTIAISSPISS